MFTRLHGEIAKSPQNNAIRVKFISVHILSIFRVMLPFMHQANREKPDTSIPGMQQVESQILLSVLTLASKGERGHLPRDVSRKFSGTSPSISRARVNTGLHIMNGILCRFLFPEKNDLIS